MKDGRRVTALFYNLHPEPGKEQDMKYLVVLV